MRRMVRAGVSTALLSVPALAGLVMILDPIAVMKDNVKDTVVKDEFYTVDQICTDQYADACAAAGLS